MSKTPLIFYLTILLFAFIAIADLADIKDNYAVAGEAERKVPRAEFLNPDFIFQVVPEGTKVIHDFIVKNSGENVLLIKSVKTG